MSVALKFEPTRESLGELKRLERDTPVTFMSAYAGAVRRAWHALKALMRKEGGKYAPHFAPRQPSTLALHPGTKPGGVLANPKMMYYRKTGPGQFYLSWVGTLGEWGAKNYQAGKTYAMSPGQRQFFYRRRVDAPQVYDRPARPVIEPLHGYLSTHFAQYVTETYNRIAARRRARGLAVR